MTYYYSKTTHFEFDEAVSRVTQALKEEGFGILTEDDVALQYYRSRNAEWRC